MKLLLYGDLHAANLYSFNVKQSKYQFSEYSRVDELYSTLAWISKVTKENEIMMTINMGDTFHQALRFYVERYNTVVKAVNSINQCSLSKSGVIIEGNHDRSEEVSAVDTFENVQGTVLVKNSIKVKYISEINSHLIFVPYIRDPVKTKEAFEALYEKYKNKASKTNFYLFCHLDLKEAYEGLVSSTYQLNQYNTYKDLKLDIYKAVFSGHIHFKRVINNNFYYIGSALNHNFGDSLSRKGATIVEFDPDNFRINYKENPFCPFFVKFNLEKPEKCSANIKLIEKELKKFSTTNVYARIFSLSSDEGRKKSSDFLRDNAHLFTAYEVKNLDSEEALKDSEAITNTMDHVNVFDLITEHGSKILKSQGKSQDEIEQYIMRLKRICQLN
jgi:DNA repair exonuclease SbcCD nuclease subunit